MIRRSAFLLLTVVAIAGCHKKEPPVAQKPSEAVLLYYAALNARDSVAYKAVISQTRTESLQAHPDILPRVMEHWNGRHAEVKILSERENGVVGFVQYHVKISGKDPGDTTLTLQVYKEDGSWKFGF